MIPWPSRTTASSASTRVASHSATGLYRRNGPDWQQIMTLATDEFIRRFLQGRFIDHLTGLDFVVLDKLAIFLSSKSTGNCSSPSSPSSMSAPASSYHQPGIRRAGRRFGPWR